MKKVDFYKLTRDVQDRLLASFRGEFDPKPIQICHCKHRTVELWGALTPAAMLLLGVICVVGYGSLGSPLAHHPLPAVVLYVVLCAAMAVGLLRAASTGATLRRLPFRPGIYLFPANLIDARERVLQVISLSEITEVSTTAGGAVVHFGQRQITLPAGKDKPKQMAERVKAAREHYTSGLAGTNRSLLDPLEPPAVVGPFESQIPLRDNAPLWQRLQWLIAAAVGLLGVGVFVTRNNLSDNRKFAVAKASDDVASYQRYLAAGHNHRDEVSTTLLPRAELRLAVAKGSVEAIDDFAKAYPNTAIGDEIAAARRAALEQAFAEADKAGSLAALKAFAERYPKHHLKEQLAKSKHAIYQRAVAALRRKLPEDSKDIGAFVERLAAFAERVGPQATKAGLRGPVTEVRLRRLKSQGLERADKVVRANRYFVGDLSLPSRYFAAPFIEQPEKDAVKAFVQQLAKLFPTDVLSFAAGATYAEDQVLPKVDKPTLLISYRVVPSGNNAATSKPAGVFVGLLFFFQLDFLLPTGEPLVHKDMVTQKVPLKMVVNHKPEAPRDSLEPALYKTMTNNAFTEIRQRYLAKWQGPGGQ